MPDWTDPMPRKPSKPKPAAAASSPSPGAESPDDATLAIRDAIRAYVPEAIRELARLAHEAASEQARVSAINALIDRGYGNLKHASEGDDGAHGITVRFVAPTGQP